MEAKENEIRMKMEYDAEMEMEVLYDQIEGAVEFVANANQPYSSAQIEYIVFNLVFNIGVFDSP